MLLTVFYNFISYLCLNFSIVSSRCCKQNDYYSNYERFRRGKSVILFGSIRITAQCLLERTKWKKYGGAEEREREATRTIYLVYHARHYERCINRLEERLRAAILFHSIYRKVPLMTTGYLSVAWTTLGVVFNRPTRLARLYTPFYEIILHLRAFVLPFLQRDSWQFDDKGCKDWY